MLRFRRTTAEQEELKDFEQYRQYLNAKEQRIFNSPVSVDEDEGPYETLNYQEEKAKSDSHELMGPNTYNYKGQVEIRLNLRALAKKYPYRICKEITKRDFLWKFYLDDIKISGYTPTQNETDKNKHYQRSIQNETLIATFEVTQTHRTAMKTIDEALADFKEWYEELPARKLATRIVNETYSLFKDSYRKQKVDKSEIPRLTIQDEISITYKNPENFTLKPPTPIEKALQTIANIKQQQCSPHNKPKHSNN